MINVLAQFLNDLIGRLPDFVWPVPALHHTNSPFGMRGGDLHTGFDTNHGCQMGNNCGVICQIEIVAVADGVVTRVQERSDGFGNNVLIRHSNGMSTLYGHNHVNLVVRDASVSRGQRIAILGNTGSSTGPHLHFDLRRANGTPVNPLAMYNPGDSRRGTRNHNALFVCSCGVWSCEGFNPMQSGHRFVFNSNFTAS